MRVPEKWHRMYRELMKDSAQWLSPPTPSRIDDFLNENERAARSERAPWAKGFRKWARSMIVSR